MQLTNSSLLWADAEVEEIALTFDEVLLRVIQLNGYGLDIHARGYISFSIEGIWDDMLVSDGELIDEDAVIDRAIGRIATVRASESGNPYRDKGEFRLLRITFEAGGSIEVVAGEFSATPLARRPSHA